MKSLKWLKAFPSRVLFEPYLLPPWDSCLYCFCASVLNFFLKDFLPASLCKLCEYWPLLQEPCKMNGYVDKARYLDSDLPLVLSCDTDSFRMSARELKPSQGLIASKRRRPFESRSLNFNLGDLPKCHGWIGTLPSDTWSSRLFSLYLYTDPLFLIHIIILWWYYDCLPHFVL